jgi:DNA segregation ATPase FtsK/SpoIIIE, S-DNA-T family
MEKDELYEEAKELVIKKQLGSAPFLQRALRIGYFRAALLIDQLEENGILGEADGVRPRKVLIHSL